MRSTIREIRVVGLILFSQNFDRPDVVKLRAASGGNPRRKSVAGKGTYEERLFGGPGAGQGEDD